MALASAQASRYAFPKQRDIKIYLSEDYDHLKYRNTDLKNLLSHQNHQGCKTQ